MASEAGPCGDPLRYFSPVSPDIPDPAHRAYGTFEGRGGESCNMIVQPHSTNHTPPITLYMTSLSTNYTPPITPLHDITLHIDSYLVISALMFRLLLLDGASATHQATTFITGYMLIKDDTDLAFLTS